MIIDYEKRAEASYDEKLKSLAESVQRAWNVLSDMVTSHYPVGSYYETSDATFNPNTIWGGTWVLEDNSTTRKWHRTA